MRFRFQYRRYRLPFRAAVRTAHGVWSEREGVVVKLERHVEGGGVEKRRVGFGEAAPIPWFGTETVEEIEEAARGLGEWIEGERDEVVAQVPVRLGCLRNALAAAWGEIEIPD